MATPDFPIYIDGEFTQSTNQLTVTNPYDGNAVERTWLAGPSDLERATVAAQTASQSGRSAPVFDRATLLRDLAAKLKDRREQVIDDIVREATVEVDRGVFTIETAAE